jgi:hypothetical protein
LNVPVHHPATAGLGEGGKLIEPDVVLLLFSRKQTDEYDVGAVERVTKAPVLLHADMIAFTMTQGQRFPDR